MAVTTLQNSILRTAELRLLDGVEFWDSVDIPAYFPRTDDVIYRVRAGDRIDNLANRFYGDPVLWWVIAAVNDIELPPFGIFPGEELRIPSMQSVREVYFR